jgi:hypothetical protein
LFGEGHGHSYVVLCHTPPAEDSKTKSLPISSVFQDASDELNSNNSNNNKNVIKFALLDCTHTLPTSGKTIAEKFNLKLKQRPTIFVSSPKLENGPKQVPSKNLKTGHMLAKMIKQMVLPHTIKIESSKDLKTKCLSSSYCAVLLKGGTPQNFVKDAIQNLLQTYGDSDDIKKQVSFASIDSNSLYMTGLEEFLPEMEKGVHRFVVFKKVSGGIKEGDSRLVTSMAYLPENETLSHNSMERLITSVTKGSNKSIKKLTSLPGVKTRTKKLVEQERAKRERKANAGKKKQEDVKKTHTGENDGSKEGRKAERDRRKEELRKQNPNYKEKTPEEIAEIERKRRQRMEEESAKWNIGAEDAPPEGEPVGDDGSDYFEDEDGDEIVEDLDEEDDEDIMDLD